MTCHAIFFTLNQSIVQLSIESNYCHVNYHRTLNTLCRCIGEAPSISATINCIRIVLSRHFNYLKMDYAAIRV